MKKLLFFISALAGLFFAASCEREEMAPASENAVVTYSVEIPEIATRAIGDDVSNINNLVYAVYCTAADNLEAAQQDNNLQLLYQKNCSMSGGRVTIPFELVNDKNYLILFWAQHDNVWGRNDTELKTPVSFAETTSANNNDLAAFSGVDFLKSDNLAVKRNLTLKRAVAQINIATTLADNFTITPTTSKVVVKKAGAQFNIVTQSAEGIANITFETAAVPAGNLTVNSTSYKYAAMNYIFANGNVEVDYEISYTTGTDVAGTVKNTVPGVPVAQNYRTNIIGSLLTSQADYDVVLDNFSENGNTGNVEVVTEGIVKNQNGDYEISSPNGMAYAMNNLWAQLGGTYYVVKSVDMLPYFQNGNLTIPSIPAGKTLNVYTAKPVVTRSTDAITITGLPFLINTVESGANVSLQGVTMTGTDTESLINTVEQGANVVLSDCSVNDQDDMAELVEYGVDYVVDAAEVNDEYSLKAALATGINEFTITADFVTEEVNLIAKSVIINGNHKTITSNATRAFRVTTNDVNVIFNDLNVDVATERKGTNDVRGISVDIINNVSLTLNNCTVDFTHPSANDWAYAVNVTGGLGHNVSIIGGIYEGANVVNVRGENNLISIKNATLNCTYPNNDEHYGACIWVQQEMGSSVYAEGNTFNGDNAIAFNLGTGTALEEKDNIDNTKYVAVKFGNAYYYNLAEAFAAVAESEETNVTVKVLQDHNYSTIANVAAGKTIILDLNGKAVKNYDDATGSYATITNQGKLTVKNTSETPASITLVASNDRGWNAYSSVLSNTVGGVLTVEGNVTIEHLGGTAMAYGIDNLTNGKGTSAEVVINGATVKSPYRAVRQFLNGIEANNSLTVNAGSKIYGTNKSIWMQDPSANANTGTLTVNTGAELYGDVYLSVTAGSTEWPVKASIPTSTLKNGSTVLTNNVPAGYFVKEIKDVWKVYQPVTVSNVADLKAAIKVANAIVYVLPNADDANGVYDLESKMSLAEGVSLIGIGDNQVVIKNSWSSNLFASQAHFTNTYMENIYNDNNLTIDAGIVTGDVRFKNCTFGGSNVAHQGVHFDSGNGTLLFEDCEFIGRNMLGSSIEMVTFNSCTFINKKSSQTGADKWTGVNMWGKYEFNNCVFDTEASCNVKTDGVVAGFNNCSFTDNRDIKTIIKNSNNYNATIAFDGIAL